VDVLDLLDCCCCCISTGPVATVDVLDLLDCCCCCISAGPVATVDVLDAVVQRRHGQPLILHCQFHGVPAPAVDWLKNGETIEADQQPSRVYISTVYHTSTDDTDVSVVTSELLLEQTSLRDAGMYQCRATSAAGVAILTTSVDILATGGQLVFSPVSTHSTQLNSTQV